VVNLGSARHPARVAVSLQPQGYAVAVVQGPATLPPELERSFAHWPRSGAAFVAATDAELAQWLRRASALAQSLPNQAAVDFDTQVQQALAALPAADTQSTEVQRLVRQRVGQDRYRQAMLSYWGGACAVTGLTLQPVLRASHAKPWADCNTDAERLDVFNGFLLSANLDALFDKFLISFSDAGELLVSTQINERTRHILGLDIQLKLRWIAAGHLPYLLFHRHRFEFVATG
jgi:putative restriction endonuclease